jgi:two-component response regulator ARR-A family
MQGLADLPALRRLFPQDHRSLACDDFFAKVVPYCLLLQHDPSMRAPYLLIADDDPEDIELLSQAFSRKNPAVEIKSVETGAELFGFLSGCPTTDLPSLLLLDYRLPILTAPEVLATLKQDQRYVDIPKVVWSTSGRTDFVRLCLDGGALLYFPKPNSEAELDHIVVGLTSLFHRGIL